MTKITIHTKLSFGEELLAEGEAEEVHDKVMKLVTLLPEHCQNAFYMTTVHGLSDREVGEFLNCSAERVRELMGEAIRYIRENVGLIRREISER